jgi:hypothetical protein
MSTLDHLFRMGGFHEVGQLDYVSCEEEINNESMTLGKRVMVKHRAKK